MLETIFPENLVHNLPGFTIIMFLDNVNVYLLGSVDVFMQSCTGYLVILLKLLVKQYWVKLHWVKLTCLCESFKNAQVFITI